MNLPNMLKISIPRSNPVTLIVIFYLFFGAAAVVNAIPITFIPDAYYVFTVARNLAGGAGLTFDGVSVTTGFHPLWLGITTAVYYLSANIETFQYAIFAIQTALVFSGHALLLSVALRTGICVQAFLLVSVPVFGVHLNIFQTGLENAIFFFFISLLLWLHYRNWARRLTFAIVTAVVLVLVYFSRLDGFFLLLVYLPWHFVRECRSGNFSSAVSLPAIAGGAVLIHWLVMLAAFGTIFPTSQIGIKEYLSQASNLPSLIPWASHPMTQRLQDVVLAVDFKPDAMLKYLGLLIPASLIVAVYTVATKDSIRRAPIILVGLMSLLQILYYVVRLNGWMQPWYFTGWFILAVFGTSYLMSNILGKMSMNLTAVLLVVAMSAFLVTDAVRSHQGWPYFADRSQILREYQERDAVLVSGTPDVLSFYSGVPIRHLEGAMNGYEFATEYLKPGKVASYMEDIGATHYAKPGPLALTPYIPCVVELASDRDGAKVALGIYDQHNSYVAMYRVKIISEETPEIIAGFQEKCGPVIGEYGDTPSTRRR